MLTDKLTDTAKSGIRLVFKKKTITGSGQLKIACPRFIQGENEIKAFVKIDHL